MPIFKAEFKVSTYYTINIDADNWAEAENAAYTIDFEDLEVEGTEVEWRKECDFSYMSRKPIIQGEGKIFNAQELLNRYEEND